MYYIGTNKVYIHSYLIYLIKVFISFYFIVEKWFLCVYVCSSMRSFLRVVTIYTYNTQIHRFSIHLILRVCYFVARSFASSFLVFSFFLSQSFALFLFILKHHRYHWYSEPSWHGTAWLPTSSIVIVLFLISL